jgi:hypothetical protein
MPQEFNVQLCDPIKSLGNAAIYNAASISRLLPVNQRIKGATKFCDGLLVLHLLGLVQVQPHLAAQRSW